MTLLPTRQRLLAASGIVLLGLATSLAAQAGAREDLNRFTQGLQGLDGEFTQKVFDTNGKLKEASSGSLAVEAPQHFRWEYVKPYPQVIVADGETVWIYEPDLDQVTRKPQGEEEKNSPLGALIDPSRLDRQFKVSETGQADGLAWLTLAPKDANVASFDSAQLGFREGALVKMKVVDSLGQRTEIDFSQWKRNPSFGPDTFRFTPPPGVDVIGEG
ncbi:outer membrane lipoprotein chaperone LolA [Marilutibacter aestuarii]|uniref:Outer-membrane lipoprotein carrier protein n=1 Tax=Marilutibacter aestuarii TaxID=1706195 RepID=A0A508A4W1_9GAMM|nr:outer membrane lipoprotein chaperone LolA [Lysobacter aestuarii]TQD40842.1 outer membrane lipoprotein chaperone LolA [Lysobacter aestuarii]